MNPTTRSQVCCYCGDSFATGEDILCDSGPIFPEWEVMRHELLLPYHRVCWCWNRIDRWLCANAPRVFRELGNPATDEEIDLTERRFQNRFPLDLRRSYRIHNGSGEAWLFKQGTLLSLQWIRGSWMPPERVWVAAWNHIPFVANGGGDYCCVDCSPAAGGIPGQVFWLSHETGAGEVMANGFQYYLEQFTDSLEQGHYIERQYNTFPALVSSHP